MVESRRYRIDCEGTVHWQYAAGFDEAAQRFSDSQARPWWATGTTHVFFVTYNGVTRKYCSEVVPNPIYEVREITRTTADESKGKSDG